MSFVRDEGGLLWVTPPKALTDGIVIGITEALSARLKKAAPYVALFDLSGAGVPNAVQRQLLATHMRSNSGLIQRWVRGLAIIAPSAVVRGVATAIFWIEAPRVPHDIFASGAQAETWARSRLASGPHPN